MVVKPGQVKIAAITAGKILMDRHALHIRSGEARKVNQAVLRFSVGRIIPNDACFIVRFDTGVRSRALQDQLLQKGKIGRDLGQGGVQYRFGRPGAQGIE